MEERLITSKGSYPQTNNETNINHSKPEAKQGIIWKIDRFATHDGPGIRTLLYFKGCSLRCKWCSNPEGQTSEPDLVFLQMTCTGCGLCVEGCSIQALELGRGVSGTKFNVNINRLRCNLCGVCASACPTNALQIWGKRYSVPDLLEIIERDRLIHKRSGGGLSCTGGEPLCQAEFLRVLLEECHRRGIHTAVETCAYVDEEPFKAILQVVDWLFIDLKHMDTKMHQTYVGKSNDLILRNIRLASSTLHDRSKALVIRMVVIPGINDGRNISDMGDFLCSLPFVTMVELLPYHRYGVYKYDLLGRSYGLTDVKPPTTKAMGKYKKSLEDKGLVVA